MLYVRWCEIVRQNPTGRALTETASGRAWTFAELDQLSAPPPTGDGLVCPAGNSPDFIITTLRAWRHGRVLCPLEPGQPPPNVPPPPASCVHLKLTSGSTGAPKAIAFTAAQLAADAANIVATMGLRPDWPNLGVISLAHSYGFSNLVTPLLLHGIPLVLVASGLPEAVARASRSAAALTLAAVPALWRTWNEAAAIPEHTRLAISAGAPLPLELERAVFARSRLKIHNFYGASECGGIAYDRSPSPRADGAGVGSPLDGIRVSVGEDGCLEISGTSVGETAWPTPDPRLSDGRFCSSDLAEVVAGEIRLLGRVADLVNVAGRKVSPETIEAALLESSLVRECVVFGVPASDAARGEVIIACAEANPGTTVDSLKSYAQRRLPDWQVPRDWWLVDSLGADRRGKLSRAAWRTRYLARTQR